MYCVTIEKILAVTLNVKFCAECGQCKMWSSLSSGCWFVVTSDGSTTHTHNFALDWGCDFTQQSPRRNQDVKLKLFALSLAWTASEREVNTHRAQTDIMKVQVSTESQQLEEKWVALTWAYSLILKETLGFNVGHHPTSLTHLKIVSFAVFCFLMRLKVHFLLHKI